MKKEHSKTLAALVLLTAFAAGILVSLLSGAGVYRRLSTRLGQDYDKRTTVGYLVARVRQAEDVRLEPFEAGQALCIPQMIEGQEYATYIYCHDGWLMELFTLAGAYNPLDGERVMALGGLEMHLEDGLLTLILSWQDSRELLYLEVLP